MISIVDDLTLLAQVIEAGGFTAASRITGITKSLLSRRIAELEAHLGVQLIDRTSRRFSVTDLGMQLYRHAATIRAEVDAAELIAQQALAEPRGPLRVACPVVLAELVVGKAAVRFACEYPLTQLTFDMTSGLPNTSMDRYDIMLRASPIGLPNSEMIGRRLMLTPYELVAAPEWLAASGKPKRTDELSGLDGIGWWQTTDAPRWQLYHSGGETCEITIRPRFVTNNLAVARDAAIAGLGMARLPRPLCQQDLIGGGLQRVLEGWSPQAMTIYAAYSTRRSLTNAGRRFLEMLSATLSNWNAIDEGFSLESGHDTMSASDEHE